jgi:hypothetical protein
MLLLWLLLADGLRHRSIPATAVRRARTDTGAGRKVAQEFVHVVS